MIFTLIYGFICLVSEEIAWNWMYAWIILVVDFIFWS